MDADSALSLLGKYSRWQLESYFVLAIGFSLPYAWMMMAVVFLGDTPNYRCAIPENATLNESIPFEIKDGEVVYEKCLMYANYTEDNTTVPCQLGYWYDPASGYDSTLTTEWDLVCGKEWLVELSMTISGLGTMVCAPFTRLADVYGRKTVFLVFLYSNIVIATAQALSPNIIFYIVLAFLDGIQQQGTLSASYGLALELFPAAQRTFAGNAIELFFAFGYMSLACIAYFVRNWRYLLLAITLPLLGTISFYWLTSESIPWLLANGKPEEAEKILRKAAKRSKVKLPDNIFIQQDEKIPALIISKEEKETEMTDENCEKTEFMQTDSSNTAKDSDDVEDTYSPSGTRYKILDIFRSKTLVIYSLVQYAIWFTIPLAYSAVNLTVTYLPGNRYLNTFLYAASEIPAYILAWVLCEKVGRRLPLILCTVLAGVFYLSSLIRFIDVSFNMEPLLITLSIIGKTFVTSSFAIMYVMAPEVYPTNLRVVGLGLCQFFARVAGFIAPFARTLTRHYPVLPPVIIGVLSVAVGFLGLLLPETRHRKLPDTIQEIEQWKRRDSGQGDSVQSVRT